MNKPVKRKELKVLHRFRVDGIPVFQLGESVDKLDGKAFELFQILTTELSQKILEGPNKSTCDLATRWLNTRSYYKGHWNKDAAIVNAIKEYITVCENSQESGAEMGNTTEPQVS